MPVEANIAATANIAEYFFIEKLLSIDPDGYLISVSGPPSGSASGSLQPWVALVHLASAFVRRCPAVPRRFRDCADWVVGARTYAWCGGGPDDSGSRDAFFPRFVTERRLPTQYLFRLGRRAIPVLQYLERVVHPRWPIAFDVGRRFVGIVVLLLTAVLLLTPIPLSNIAPAVLIVLISLAYIEQDGLLLWFAFSAAIILVGIASAAVWGTIFSALLITHS